MRADGADVIDCANCGRTDVDLEDSMPCCPDEVCYDFCLYPIIERGTGECPCCGSRLVAHVTGKHVEFEEV